MVGLRERKTKYCHYFLDSKGRYQGEFKDWHSNGQLRENCILLNGKRHGERKWRYKDGKLKHHEFWVKGKLYRDLIKKPVCSDEEKFLIALETGAPWLD